ncbi:MAG: ATP-binding protein [Chloroflexota bacterium]|nr:ATP-binding protein [Chloroflexota bacterium]
MPDSEESNRRIDAELVDLRSRVAALEQERAALQQQIDALAGECYRFRTLIDHLPDYIFIKDTASRFVVNNRAHIELLGCATQEEVLGKTDFDIFPRELAEQYYADEQMLIRTGHPLIDREEKTISKTGKRQWLSTTKVPMRNPEGEIIGLAGMSRDITARKEAEAALAQAFGELEKFTYMVSYDMQRPLMEIASELERLQDRLGGRIGDVSRGIIARAVDSSQHVQRLNNSLLAYSRVETWGTMPEPTDSRVVVEHALENLSERIEEEGAEVIVEDLPQVLADPAQLLEVFSILISNAVDYRSEDPPRIRISAEPADGMWRFVVRDNGIGIDPQYSEQIFDIFQRLHDQIERPGTGIGLAICKKIVERHGGSIGVESQPGEGAAFHFTLPRVEEGS